MHLPLVRYKSGSFIIALTHFLRGLGNCNRGSVAIQFSLMAPVMLTMLFGTIELGRLGFTQMALQHAAEEATRFAIVREGEITPTDIEEFAASRLTGVLNRETAVITATAPIDPVTGTSLISVEVNYDFEFILPFLPQGQVALVGDSSGFIAFPPTLPN